MWFATWVIEVLFAFPLFIIRWLLSERSLPPTGKCVLITGCDSGIGLGIAVMSARLGFEVIATCLNPNGDGARLLRTTYPRIQVIGLDVSVSESVYDALESVNAHLASTQSKLWALINNAGILVYGHFDWQLESQVNAQLNVNLLGVLRMTKTFLPLIHLSKGRLINITSANGNWCLPGLSVYCATKHAIEGFSNSLRMEMLPWGVKVILVNPGNIPNNTRIMSRQSQYLEEMKANFTEDQTAIYGRYFDHFHAYLKRIFDGSITNAQPLDDNGLEKIVKSVLLHKEPNHYYENLSFGFRLFILITKILPTFYADRLMMWLWGTTVGYNLL